MASRTQQAHDYKLKVAAGDAVEYYDLRDEPITIGRARDNNLTVRDGRASRMHCKLERDGDAWQVIDTGSQNGTFMNGRRVRKASLRPGDVLQVGSTRITLEKKSTVPELSETRTETEIKVEGGIEFTDEPLTVETLFHLQSVASALNSELNLDKLLSLIVDHAVKLTGAERGFLILMGKKDMEFRVARNFEQQDVSAPEFAVSWSIATQVSTSGQAVLCVNAAEDDRFKTEESVLALGLRSVMCVPFKMRNRVIGVIYVDNRLHKGVFSKTDFRILGILADHAAVALENARLYHEVVDQKSSLESDNRRLHLRLEEQDSRLRTDGQDDEASELGRLGVKGSLVGESAPMRDLKALIRKVAASSLPVLVTGESGTGKELVARAIHELSDRKARKMVGENCCAIPETLLESELFGYRKGAFTGATSDKDGLFVTAAGGTLYLDEIGDLGISLQTKLLRVLQEGEVRPIGGEEAVQVDVRLISSTNRDLPAMIEKNEFREDLFYRIKVVLIQTPPLRERREDIPLLIDHFLTIHRAETGQKVGLTKEALEILKAYNWPGNVRELENGLKSMIALGGDVLDKDDVPSHIHERVELLVGEESDFHDLNELVESIECREISKALRRVRGNKTKAADLLGISRFALQRKMDKYAIDLSSLDI